MMREIGFIEDLIPSVLDGTKTQTRRLVVCSTEHDEPYNPAYIEVHRNSDGWAKICPYGVPGERLAVKEHSYKLRPIIIEIVSVRVERLHDISDEDAKAEGVDDFFGGVYFPDYLNWSAARANFRRLWESIHGAGSWDANPFCWVIEFKRVQ